MKLAKQINGQINLVEVEDGHEVGGDRTEHQLYADGYKKACGDGQGDGEWVEHPTCFVWVERQEEPEPQEEFTDEEALNIIMGGEQ